MCSPTASPTPCPPRSPASAYEAAGRALALNPQLSLGYSVLGLLQMLDGQHEQAVASARKAVALSPNSAEAYLNLAVVLVYARSARGTRFAQWRKCCD